MCTPSNKLECDPEHLNIFADLDAVKLLKFCHTPRNLLDVFMRFDVTGTSSRRKWERRVDDLISLGLMRQVPVCDRVAKANWRKKSPQKVFVSDVHTFMLYFDGSKLNLMINNEVKIVHEVI